MFSLENIAPEIVVRIRYNKPVKVPLTLVHYGKILHTAMVSRKIFPVVHSLWYCN